MDERSFVLKSDDENFKQRQHNVFDQLLALEKTRHDSSASQSMEVDQPAQSPKLSRAVTRPFRGKESIFKKPNNPVPKNYIHKIPDFKKNPHKWTRYSLDDVKDEDISDKSNTKAALSFLNELKSRKNEDQAPQSQTASQPQVSDKIVFRKHNITPKRVDDDDEKPTFKSSKLLMPEYVVGQKIRKDKKNKAIKKGNVKELKLDHLLDDEDEEST